jgi:hypothetical protein
MAERLPTVKPEVTPTGEALSPALKQPPPPLHPDRFSTGATPPANAMQPGAATPVAAPAPKVKAETPAEDATTAPPPVKKPKPPTEDQPAPAKKPAAKTEDQPPAATTPSPAATPAPQETQ